MNLILLSLIPCDVYKSLMTFLTNMLTCSTGICRALVGGKVMEEFAFIMFLLGGYSCRCCSEESTKMGKVTMP